MKKSMFMVALATLTLASCSQDEVVELKSNEIKFTMATEKMSRASSADGQGVFCNSVQMPNFQLTANYDGAVYIQNDQYAPNGSVWENVTNTRYWPENAADKKVSFYASYNAKGNTVTSDGTDVTMDFDVAEAVADQVDLVYAAKLDQAIPAASVSGVDPVALNFRHALSQIVFQAKNTNNTLHIVVDAAAVGNVATTGTFTFPTESTDGMIENHVQHGDSATTDNLDATYAAVKGLGTWETEGVKRYEVDFADVTLDGETDDVFDLTVAVDEGLTYSKDAMLLLPTNNGENKTNVDATYATYANQAWNPAGNYVEGLEGKYNGTYLAVKCKIYNIADPSAGYVADDVLLHDGWAVIPAEFNWEQGKKYVYTFVFGNGNGGYEDDSENPRPVLVPMSFTVSVDDFLVKNEGHKDMETK